MIHVVMRMTPDSHSPLSGSSSRPSWFNKETVFRSIFLTSDEYTDITIVFDGDYTGHWINKYHVKKIIRIQAGTGDESFQAQIHSISTMDLPEEDILYICEDDYLHKSGWCDILREGLSKKVIPDTTELSYITLYDHYDKYHFNDEYSKEVYSTLLSHIFVSKSVHWRTIPSTTNTFAMKVKTFMDDIDTHMIYKNSDNEKFISLEKTGRVLASCIPGWSTHCHKDFLSPCVSWEESIRQST